MKPQIYVSDVISGFSDLGQTRQWTSSVLTRQVCELIPSFNQELYGRLKHATKKCMGYPAVWSSKYALGLNDDQVFHSLRCGLPSLYVSLTTSITDDFLDANSDASVEDLMVMYHLLFAALETNRWTENEFGRSFTSSISPLVHEFLQLRVPWWKLTSSERAERALQSPKRIGLFHRMIATELLHNVSGYTTQDVCAAISFAEQFGDFCALIDDVLDLEVDMQEGTQYTRVMKLFHDFFPFNGDRPRVAEVRENASRMEFGAACLAMLTEALGELRLAAPPCGQLGQRLDQIECSLQTVPAMAFGEPANA